MKARGLQIFLAGNFSDRRRHLHGAPGSVAVGSIVMRAVGMVLNNGDLNQVTWEQRAMEGDPKFEASQDIPSVPYHRFAELIGLRGIYVDDAERMGAAWDEPLMSDRPVVLEVKADPDIPPLPPHITLAQARAFASTLIRRDPNEGNVIVETAKQVLDAVIPGHRDK